MPQISEFEWALENGDTLTQQDGSPLLLSSAHNRILIRSSTTPGAVPSAGILEIGELAVNTADARIYFKQPAGNVTEVAAGKLSVARNFTLAGDVTGTTSSDLSGTVSITATLGTVSISKGGTGLTTAPTTSQILVGQSNGSYALRTLTAGNNITLTEAEGALTIASTAAGGANVTTSDTPPLEPIDGDLWWDSESGTLRVYYEDSNSSQWVDATPAVVLPGRASISATAPTEPSNGDLWWDSSSGLLRVFYVDTDSAQWVDATQGFQQIASPTSDTLTTSATTANQVVAILPASEYRSVKYVLQVTAGSAYQASEILMVHDGTTVHMTEYATINTGASLATFTADISGGNMRLLVTPANAVTTVKARGTPITV